MNLTSSSYEGIDMEPMKPMKPMAPMQPMAPMKPMSDGEAWWPEDLGEPSSSGSQNGMRYAFFSAKRRLILQRDGKTATYDSGDHEINGVSQQSSAQSSAVFSSQDGNVDIASLKKLD